MYLDAPEERMLRAIAQTAVVVAAAGRSFVGEFRHYRISATCLEMNEQGVVHVEARIVFGAGLVVQIHRGFVLAAQAEPCALIPF